MPENISTNPNQSQRISATINVWKSKLLDLSKRNRALNFKVQKVSTVTIVDEQPVEIFKLLCLQGKSLKFLPQAKKEKTANLESNVEITAFDVEDLEENLPAPDFVPYEANNLADHYTDDYLQTNASPEQLDKSLRRLEEQARLIIEEQGVNALFLSLGTLHYRESADSQEFYKTPLILVPVELSRKSARAGFTITTNEDETVVNPSLLEYLRRNFGITLPEIPDSSQLNESYDVQQFFAEVADAISQQKEWKVKTEIYLALFSFQKLAMYKDLEKNAASLATHMIIGNIITRSGRQFVGLPEEVRQMELDHEFAPEATAQVVDADSSQLRAISAVARNYDLVLEGPPGTGKSQTITNLIAQTLSAGKSVLFVAEKMAALEVVCRRLVAVGLGESCLELHSTKANKRAVMQQIRNALDASLQRLVGTKSSIDRLPVVRTQLTEYARTVHASFGALNLSPYRVYGELGKVLNAPKILLEADIYTTTQAQLADVLRDLKDLAVAAEAIGSPSKHIWRDTIKTFYSEYDLDQINALGAEIKTCLGKAIELAETAENSYGLPPIRSFADVETAVSIASVIAQSPGAPLNVVSSEAWNSPPPEANNLIEKGRNVVRLGEHASQAQILRNDNYDSLLSEALNLIESGRKIITLQEQVLKVRVLSDEMYERFVFETHRLIESGRKIARLRGQIAEKFNATVNEQNPSDDITYVEQKSSGFFSFLAFLDGRYRAIKKRWLSYRLSTYQASLIEQANHMKMVAELWRERRDLEAKAALGQQFFGSLWQDKKSNWDALEKYVIWVLAFRHLCIESSSILDFANVQLIEKQADEVRSTLVGHCQAAELQQGYLGTWELMGKDLKTVVAYFRERQNLKERDSLGVAFFGSLWEGENSNWEVLENYVAWVKNFRHLYIENNLHKRDSSWKNTSSNRTDILLQLEKEAANMRSLFLEHQRTKGSSPGYLDSWLVMEKELKTVAEYLREKQNLETQAILGLQLFGALWKGEASNWQVLENYIAWVLEFRRLCVQYGLQERTMKTASQPAPDMLNVRLLVEEAQKIQTKLKQFCTLVGFRENYFTDSNLSEILNRISDLLDHIRLAPRWAAFETSRQKVERGRAAELLPLAMSEQLAFNDLAAAFERGFYQKWLVRVIQERPPLLHFQTLTHEQRVKEFQELDERVLRENRAELIGLIRERLQSNLQKPGLHQAMSFLRGQLTKQRGLLPLRTTMKLAFPAIRTIKPCFMMSPQSVAQLLENIEDKFDVVIFDEASQLPTEEAVGAILRGRQLVVVGDPKQLPPTNFFAVQSGTVNVQYDEDGLPLYEDSQSILEDVAGAGVPNSRLKWHYRSAYESLITFSNVSFYDAELYTFPSVETENVDAGLHFEFVADGVYEGKGLNLIEGRQVADAVIRHAKTKPDVSLGVGTFNMRQQLAIQDELEQRRRQDPSIESFFDRNKEEPFFVKNLENIQGDERDVIFISVTYAKATDGRLRYNFGPLNSENGWRRLNVLTTRARKLMRVFSSIRGQDINPVATTSRGAQLLRDFLTYAEHKRLDSPVLSVLAETESPFERDVFQELTRCGVQLVPQVGVSGYRIDFGVLDDDVAGRFVCGIECDGVTYHSSETARDRDRLRQQVLETRGWEIHRLWSTDWFKDRSGQIERLRDLIEQSRQRARHQEAEERERKQFAEAERERQAQESLGKISDTRVENLFGSFDDQNYVRPTAENYGCAELPNFVPSQGLLEMPTNHLARIVLHVAEIEAPLHYKDVTTRTAAFFGTKAGSRIQSRIVDILQLLRQARHLELRGEFVFKPNSEVRVRSRSEINIPAERIAPEEVQEAILMILRVARSGLTRQNLINEVRALFGFNRTGAALKQVIDAAIEALLTRGIIGEGSAGISLRK
ncbi:MAG: hypothetical protein V7641_5307 [Blastocatellia bacterium]